MFAVSCGLDLFVVDGVGGDGDDAGGGRSVGGGVRGCSFQNMNPLCALPPPPPLHPPKRTVDSGAETENTTAADSIAVLTSKEQSMGSWSKEREVCCFVC